MSTGAPQSERAARRGTASEIGPVVLFDGECGVCNALVNWIIDRDPRARFRFAPLRSRIGRTLLDQTGLVGGSAAAVGDDSVVLIENGRYYVRSTAALRIARYLSGLWPLLYGLTVVPRPLRDAVYQAFARRRHRWSGWGRWRLDRKRRGEGEEGESEVCRVPASGRNERFLR